MSRLIRIDVLASLFGNSIPVVINVNPIFVAYCTMLLVPYVAKQLVLSRILKHFNPKCRTKIQVKHHVYKHVFCSYAFSLLEKHGCPYCAKLRQFKIDQEFCKELRMAIGDE